MKRAIIMALCVILAACGKGGGSASGGDKTGAASAGGASAPVAAEAPMGPAPGKWRLTVSVSGRDMPPHEICYAKRMTLAEGDEMAKQAGVTCAKREYHRIGDAVIGHSECTIGQMQVVTDVTASGDFSHEYTVVSKSTRSPAPMPGMEHGEVKIHALRLGDCDKDMPTVGG